MRSSDSLNVICPRRLFHSSDILDRSNLEGTNRSRTSGSSLVAHRLCCARELANANGRRSVAADPGSPLAACHNAASGVAFRHAQTLGPSLPGSRGQQVPNSGANSIHCRRATHGQFILATFLPALARINTGLQHSISESLIRMLQHSIRGAWLTLTSAGVAPARQTDLASPHVQRMVRRFIARCQARSLSLDYEASSANVHARSGHIVDSQ